MQTAEVTTLLPATFRRTVEELSEQDRKFNPLAALLDVIAATVTRLQQPLDAMARQLDPLRAQPRFVLYLADWLDMPWLGELAAGSVLDRSGQPHLQLDALRVVLAAAPVISAWRGTARGLVTMLQLATSCDGFEVKETARPFEIEVLIPAAARSRLPLVTAIVEQEKPAHATWKATVKQAD